MFADAAVYGVSLYAVGRDARHKLSAARLAGMLQLALAVAAHAETGRRVVMGSAPEEIAMIGVSLLALAANLGVIVAGFLVAWTASPVPDWIIGFMIGTMVLIGAVRIIRLR